MLEKWFSNSVLKNPEVPQHVIRGCTKRLGVMEEWAVKWYSVIAQPSHLALHHLTHSMEQE